MESSQVVRGVTVITLGASYDPLDESTTGRLDKCLREAASQSPQPRLLLDMSNTERVGSTFIGALFGAARRMKAVEGKLAVCCANEFCSEVLKVTRADHMFANFPTRDAGIQALTPEA